MKAYKLLIDKATTLSSEYNIPVSTALAILSEGVKLSADYMQEKQEHNTRR